MAKNIRHLFMMTLVLVAHFTVASARQVSQNSPLFECKAELIGLLRRADQQRDWMKELSSKKEIDLSQLSLSQIKETVAQLEQYKEKLMHHQDKGYGLGHDEQRYLLLVQELIRQLTKARIAYQKRMKTSHSVKKIAIPLGTAAAVTGGLVLLGTFVPDLVDIDLSTAILCGLATGAAVGAITYQGDVMRGLHALKESVTTAWRTQSLRAVGQVTASVAGAAALGGMIWSKRTTLAHAVGWRSTKKKSLEQMAYENLPQNMH